MKTKLILIEGETRELIQQAAKQVERIVNHRGVTAVRVKEVEGSLLNLSRLAHFTESEYEELLLNEPSFAPMIIRESMTIGKHRYIDYEIPTLQASLPKSLMDQLKAHATFQFPFERHIEIVEERFESFVHKVASETDSLYIVEAAMILAPLHYASLQPTLPETKLVDYVQRLDAILAPLQPWLIYIGMMESEQDRNLYGALQLNKVRVSALNDEPIDGDDLEELLAYIK
ncbi:hypothetical protein N781_03910 [Pontibacillus halophilus JSM 076056 = DSM 19796]|uniref:Uncharacterized protein n=1 Tax=Pontibacillus halophilus JSM 076056 = DSM 19796 TaxID=1385510 RepID=A0A0A5I778_9BACI|nr:hypothetical protein [Pontibacillus halophilus]KGX91692.1 hypothetical protein N781_03910 [Pontibacillus halophilus JSM 076056 = DSM 19796]